MSTHVERTKQQREKITATKHRVIGINMSTFSCFLKFFCRSFSMSQSTFLGIIRSARGSMDLIASRRIKGSSHDREKSFSM